MTTLTANLKLKKYEEADVANLTDQYNGSMDILDAAVSGNTAKIDALEPQVEAAATAAALAEVKTTADAAKSQAQTNATAIEGLEADVSGIAAKYQVNALGNLVPVPTN